MLSYNFRIWRCKTAPCEKLSEEISRTRRVPRTKWAAPTPLVPDSMDPREISGTEARAAATGLANKRSAQPHNVVVRASYLTSRPHRDTVRAASGVLGASAPLRWTRNSGPGRGTAPCAPGRAPTRPRSGPRRSSGRRPSPRPRPRGRAWAASACGSCAAEADSRERGYRCRRAETESPTSTEGLAFVI